MRARSEAMRRDPARSAGTSSPDYAARDVLREGQGAQHAGARAEGRGDHVVVDASPMAAAGT